jgi:hypothetical protein
MAMSTCGLGLVFSTGDVRDCQSHGGIFVIYNAFAITNCLFERCYTDLEAPPDSYQIVLSSLFLGGYFNCGWQITNSIIKNNLFDRTAIYADFNGIGYDGGYNAFLTNCDRLNPTNTHDVVLSNADYQIGPLGNYYYPTNGGMLSRLINKGSTNANLTGLYHYTVMTNLVGGLEIKETNSIVDIGFHYVAVDSNGNPSDADGDGTPDYIEDANGNGSVDSGETDWQSATDLGLKVMITRPRNGSTIP